MVLLKLKQLFNLQRNRIISYNTDEHYDIIGDVHGYNTELNSLLTLLGYATKNGVWQHPERKAVFVGDFVSRGPDSLGVMKTIRSMVENGTGYAILGNHELNVIGYFSLDKKGQPYYQPPPSNKIQMERIRAQFANCEGQLEDYVKWLKGLPFFLNFGRVRVVHAYWSDKHVRLINQTLTQGRLTRKLIKEIIKGKSDFAQAVKQTTRGIELNLPKDLIIKDAKNIRRTNFRILWWESPHGQTFRHLSYGNRFVLPDYTVPEQILFPFEVYEPGHPLVFFGHYCISSAPLAAAPNVCCMDGCVAGNGRLVAYRWSGEAVINESHFVSVASNQK
jgi:hypothetical protein